MSMTFEDKLLPIQPGFREYFQGSDLEMLSAMNRVVMESSGLGKPQDQFTLETSEKMPLEHMASSPMILRFLEMMIRLTGAKRILEIGTFVGVSAMSMARQIPKDGRIVTVEKFDHFATLARTNFQKNGFADRIEVIEGDALQQVERISKLGPYDFFFLDGNKENYLEYLTKLGPCVRKGGVVIVDDVFFQGDALNAKPSTEKGAGVKRVLDQMKIDETYFKLTLPISNGVMILLKQ